jgi:signal transduction histidine kinase/DNA-binding response OmpR family regulator
MSSEITIRILLVEDNPGDVRLLQESLGEGDGAGFELEVVDRLSAGLERLAKGGIDLVLLDLGLSDCRGLETLVRARAAASYLPLIVLTTLDDEAVAVQAVQRGAQDYLVKGQIESRLLTRAIRYAIERKRAEETLQALYRASLHIQEPLALRERLDRLLQTARDILYLDRLVVLLSDPEGRWLKAVASLGTEDPLESIRVPIGPQGGGLAKAYLTKEAIFWDGSGPVPEELRLRPPYDQIASLRSKAFANIPLVVQGRAIGVLGVDSKRSRRPLHPEMHHLLQLFAAQAALAIEHGRLYEEQRMAAIQLEATVEARTRDLRAANVRLEETSRVAEEASRHKSAFLANMSHELRTPLNAILGFSELLAQQTYGPLTEKQARYVDNVHTSGQHLLALINDLLDLSKVEAGKLELHPQAFHLREALEAALRIFHLQAEAKQQLLHHHVADDLPVLTADPLRVRQILYNLLSNAVKFTPPGGAITVTAKQVRSAECGVRSETNRTSHVAPRTSHVARLLQWKFVNAEDGKEHGQHDEADDRPEREDQDRLQQ